MSKEQQFWDAADKGDLSVVKKLAADSTLDINWQGQLGYTPFNVACQKGHKEVVSMLLHLSKKQISGNGKMPAPIPAAIRQGRMATPFRLPFRCHFVLRRGQGSRHSGQEPEGAPLPPPFTPPREHSSFRIAGELGLIGPPVILSASSPHPTLLKRFEWRGIVDEDGCLPPRWSS